MNYQLAAKNVLGALYFDAGHAVRTADVNQSAAADIVLLEAVGDFVGDVERLINQICDDGLLKLVVRSLREEIHLAGRAVGIKRERFHINCLTTRHLVFKSPNLNKTIYSYDYIITYIVCKNNISDTVL